MGDRNQHAMAQIKAMRHLTPNDLPPKIPIDRTRGRRLACDEEGHRYLVCVHCERDLRVCLLEGPECKVKMEARMLRQIEVERKWWGND